MIKCICQVAARSLDVVFVCVFKKKNHVNYHSDSRVHVDKMTHLIVYYTQQQLMNV